jgi:hypothetical protein
MTLPWEREFLKLAAVWLACRWTVLGGQIPACPWALGGLAFQLLGMSDYKDEMRLLIEELQCTPTNT